MYIDQNALRSVNQFQKADNIAFTNETSPLLAKFKAKNQIDVVISASLAKWCKKKQQQQQNPSTSRFLLASMK